ncbi:MAG: S8 family serine peptidase [Oligoflexus sp.]
MIKRSRALSAKYLVILGISLFATVSISCQNDSEHRRSDVKRIGSVDDRLVLSWKTAVKVDHLDLPDSFTKEFATDYPIRFAQHLFTTYEPAGFYTHTIEAEASSQQFDLQKLIDVLNTDPRTVFAANIYKYQGQGLENSSNFPADETGDPLAHLEAIGAFDAWDISRGDESVVIAVTDDGFDFDHQDLKGGFWQNQGELGQDEQGKEKNSNGLDDDGNGYIDDHRGWDFTKAGDNNPSPENGLFFNLDSHGTHITGIITAQHREKSGEDGVWGIAPEAKVMALRFSGSGTWTSINIARSYAYAVAKGAKIINTSYAIDQYVDDPVYQAAIRHAYASGLLIFNSAGNQGEANPDRQSFEEIFLVANTYAGPESRDRLHPNSNFGYGIDFTAPGDIYSTIPGNRYQYKVGTSMATPVVAAVAALIWSANPEWTRDQVAAQLAGTAQAIDEINPGYEGLLGFGRVDAARALLTQNIAPPQLTLQKQRLAITDGKIVLRCLSVLDEASLKNAEFLLYDHLDRAHPLSLLTDYRIGSNEIVFAFPADLQPGSYRLHISADVRDPFGQALDGNGDGQGGDPLVADVEITRSHQASPYIEGIHISQEKIQAGQTLQIELHMRDQHQQLNQAKLGFMKEDGSIQLSVVDSGLDADGCFTFALEIPKEQDNGRYLLTQIELISVEGNKSSFVMTSPNEETDQGDRPIIAGFTVYGGIDRDRVGPLLTGIEIPSLGSMNTSVPIQIQAIDQASGVKRIEVLLRSTETFQTLRAERLISDEYHAGTYDLELALPALERRQQFFVSAVILTDGSGNISRFQASDRSETLTNSSLPVPRIYLVEDLNSDTQAPKLLDVQLLTPAAYRGESAKILIHAIDEESEIGAIRVFFRKDLVVMTSFDSFQMVDIDLYEVVVPINKEDDTGSYRLYKIELEDDIGNRIAYQSLNRGEETYPGTTIPVLHLDVQARTPIDIEGPQIQELKLHYDKTSQQLQIDVVANDPSGIDYIDLSLIGLEDDRLALWSDSGIQTIAANTYRIHVRLDAASQPGTYFVNYLLAADRLGNLTSLHAESQQTQFEQSLVRVPRFRLESWMLP